MTEHTKNLLAVLPTLAMAALLGLYAILHHEQHAAEPTYRAECEHSTHLITLAETGTLPGICRLYRVRP